VVVALEVLRHQMELVVLTLFFLRLPQPAVVGVAQVLLLMGQRFLEVPVAVVVAVQVRVPEHLELLIKDVPAVMQLIKMALVEVVAQAPWEIMGLVVVVVVVAMVLHRLLLVHQ
jgi:hypothetical protein